VTAADATPSGACVVPPEAAGTRLDRLVAEQSGAPRNQVQAWIRDGRVQLDDVPAAKPGEALRAGARIAWEPPPLRETRVLPEAGELRMLHEDADLLALDKPAGLVVHPGAGRATGTLVHRLLDRYPELAGVGGAGRPGIVHRLDKDTSGVLLVARTPAAYRELVRLFASRAIDKRYLAIVYGAPAAASGTIEAPIARHRIERQRMTVRAGGRPATTGWRTLAAAGAVALLELTLHTGRTHQIRVHLKHFAHPLIGDPVYGEARWRGVTGPARRALEAFPRPALHAWRLRLPHPNGGAELTLEAPAPADLVELWSAATQRPWPVLPAGR
jgi:23S rRNA pseudouridine1911/1915/1917 synthase